MRTKKIKIMITAATIFISSCSKTALDPKEEASQNKVSGTMKATLDGKAWEAKKLSFGGAFSLIQINGSIDDDNLISIELDDSKLKLNMSYELGSEASRQELQSLVLKHKGAIYLGKSGTLKITKYTRGKTVEGEIDTMLSDGINPEIKLDKCTFSITYK